MDVSGLISQVELEGGRLGAAAAAVEFDAEVPGCPEWTVRDLVSHVGGVHRWATAIVGGPLLSPKDVGDTGTAPGDDDLLEWFAEGHQALVETLRAAPADVECWAFLPAPSSLAFWARRQALETAIHRTDVEAVGAEVSAYDDDLAAAGIEEMLTGFALRPKVYEPGTMMLAPDRGAAWLVTLGADGISAVVGAAGDVDVTIGGEPSEVYRWLWNRPATVAVTGDAAVAAQWSKIRVRWG